MKKFLLIALVLGFSSVFSNTFAQEKNFVISTSNPHYIPVIIKTANTIAENHKNDLGEIQIVLYGKAVKGLDESEATAPWLKKTQNKAIKFSACNIALDKQKVNKNQIPKQFNIVANAFVYILKLKEKGYYGLDL